MHTPSDVLLDRLDEIAQRLARLESAVISADDACPTNPAPEPKDEAVPLQALETEPELEAEPEPESVPELELEREAEPEPEPELELEPSPSPAPITVAPPRPTPRPAREPEPQGLTLESFVGGRLFAVVGALIVIAGAGLGMKVAWDLGYFRLLNDAGKSASMGGFSAVLVLVGEFARRRWGRAAGEGLSAAGLGVLFATVYAMTARFGLLGWTPGVGALLGVAVLGFAVSARGGMVVTPAVTVVGAFAVPLLMGEPTGSEGVLALYWLTLSALAHALCAFRGLNFAPARTCAWWGSIVVGGGWAYALIEQGDAAWPVAYLAGVWILAHAELWRSCARRAQAWPKLLLERSIGGAVSTTLWSLALGFLGAHALGWESWALPAALAAANLGVAVSLVGVRGLLRTPEGPAEILAVTLAIVGGSLAILTGLLALGGWFEPVAYTLAGAACVMAGTRTRTGWIRAYGYVNVVLGTLLALAALHLREGMSVSVGEIELTRWSAVVGVAGVAWLVCAVVSRATTVAPGLAGLALGLLGFALVDDAPDLRWLGPAWGMLSFVFLLGHRFEPGLRLDLVGLIGLLAAILTWAPSFLGDGWESGVVFGTGVWSVHEGVLVGAGYVGALLLAAQLVVTSPDADDFASNLANISRGGAAALALVATSFDVARLAEVLTADETARRAAVSIWWGLYGLGLLGLGGWRRVALMRHAGLALLSIATLKAVLFDLVAVAPGWRAASFLLLGVLLLVVATAYARSAARGRGQSD